MLIWGDLYQTPFLKKSPRDWNFIIYQQQEVEFEINNIIVYINTPKIKYLVINLTKYSCSI